MPGNIVRFRRAFNHRGLRLLLALVLALGMTVFASMATQQSAHAAVASAAPFPVAHKCEAIGIAPNGNQAVVCSTINTLPNIEGTEAWGTGEYFCQGPSGQCAGIRASNDLVVPQKNATLGIQPFFCQTTACPNGGRALVSTTHFVVTSGCLDMTATVDRAAAILVNGTSTAFHPPTSLHASATVCA